MKPTNCPFLLLIFLATCNNSEAQNTGNIKRSGSYLPVNTKDPGVSATVDSFYLAPVICKNNAFFFYPGLINIQPAITESKQPEKQQAPGFLTIHGSIAYDYFYRSRIDTPYYQQDLQQHAERVSLDILIKEKYPFRVAFTARQSNSPFFRNFLDPNLQFDKLSYNRILKRKLEEKITASINAKSLLPSLEDSIKAQLKKLDSLNLGMNNPATLQKIIEERERKASGFNKPTPDLANLEEVFTLRKKFNRPQIAEAEELTVPTAAREKYESNKKQVDSLSLQISVLQKKADSVKMEGLQKLAHARKKINAATSEKQLEEIAAEYAETQEPKSGFSKIISNIKTASIGRSLLNYTELTAQNITITGVNIEYNPGVYLAVAAGKIDYRFRDFYNKSNKNNGQYLALARFGLRTKHKQSVIFTAFKGRKSQSQYALPDSIQNNVNIFGYSIETIFKLNERTGFSAEFAKSTKPIAGNSVGPEKSGALWKLEDKTNMGVNLKAHTEILKTNTKFSGFYRKTGEHFQSFSLFSYNIDQVAWQLRGDQSILKNKLQLTAMLRRNDFINPFAQQTFKTTTTFKSLLINIRVPKYPSISLGYYPGTQLYIIDKQRIRENAYYIMNGSLTHSYFYKGKGMNSSFIYNRYFNQATDSGFVLYKGIYYYASQTVLLKNLQLQGGYAYTKQPELKFFTLEASADYSFKKFLRLGAGTKYNKLASGDLFWGKRIRLSAELKKLGTLQLQYEKSYLPAISQSLYPVEIGRVSWYKYF